MRKFRTATVACFGLCSVLMGSALYAQNEEKKEEEMADPKPEVVVIVNGAELTAPEAQQRIQMHIQQMAGRVPPQQLQSIIPQVQKQVVNDFIAQTLLKDEAKKQNIEVTDEELAQEIKNIETRFPEGKTLEEVVTAQGLKIDNVKEEIKAELQARKLIKEKVPEELEVTDEELKAFYNENIEQMKKPETVKASHILIKVEDQDDEKAKAEARKQIDAIKKQLDEGGDFAELAKEKSACPSGQKGGDLGSFERGQMVKPFEDAAFTQEIDTVGDVVETRFGYHLIKVAEHEQATVAPMEEVSDNIKKHLESQKRSEAFADYIETLKADAKIEYPGKTDTDEAE